MHLNMAWIKGAMKKRCINIKKVNNSNKEGVILWESRLNNSWWEMKHIPLLFLNKCSTEIITTLYFTIANPSIGIISLIYRLFCNVWGSCDNHCCVREGTHDIFETFQLCFLACRCGTWVEGISLVFFGWMTSGLRRSGSYFYFLITFPILLGQIGTPFQLYIYNIHFHNQLVWHHIASPI
jgi:hypothetical protein